MSYFLLQDIKSQTDVSMSNWLGAVADLAMSKGTAKGTEVAIVTNQPISFGSIAGCLVVSPNASKIKFSSLNCLHGELWTTNARPLDVTGTRCGKHASIKMPQSIAQMRAAGAKSQTVTCGWLRWSPGHLYFLELGVIDQPSIGNWIVVRYRLTIRWARMPLTLAVVLLG